MNVKPGLAAGLSPWIGLALATAAVITIAGLANSRGAAARKHPSSAMPAAVGKLAHPSSGDRAIVPLVTAASDDSPSHEHLLALTVRVRELTRLINSQLNTTTKVMLGSSFDRSLTIPDTITIDLELIRSLDEDELAALLAVEFALASGGRSDESAMLPTARQPLVDHFLEESWRGADQRAAIAMARLGQSRDSFSRLIAKAADGRMQWQPDGIRHRYPADERVRVFEETFDRSAVLAGK